MPSKGRPKRKSQGTTQFISDLLRNSILDDSQRAFCCLAGMPVRLLAPAGSGKTLSLLRRCLNLSQMPDGSKYRFLVITFTRAARDELRDRLHTDDTFGPIRGSVEATTLNSWGFKRVRSIARNPRLLTSDGDKYFCVQNILQPVWKRHSAVDPKNWALD